MRRLLAALVTSIALLGAAPIANARTLPLENLDTAASAADLRNLRRALFRIGVQGARIDLGKGTLHLSPRTRVTDGRLFRALQRAGFPVEITGPTR